AAWRTALEAPAGPSAAALLAGIRAALRDDLEAPRALVLMDEWASAAGTGDPEAPARVTVILDALLGVRTAPDAGAAAGPG
ncbi:MAG: hypothetical protein QM628_18670, partial [Propionicimonas sp.]